jgi:hypothetical protein
VLVPEVHYPEVFCDILSYLKRDHILFFKVSNLLIYKTLKKSQCISFSHNLLSQIHFNMGIICTEYRGGRMSTTVL